MGLDVSFYRLDKTTASSILADDGVSIAYWDAKPHLTNMLYFRKPFQVKEVLNEVLDIYLDQSRHYCLSRLNAHHLLARIETDKDQYGWFHDNQRHSFIKAFRQMLDNFDFDKHQLTYSWIS